MAKQLSKAAILGSLATQGESLFWQKQNNQNTLGKQKIDAYNKAQNIKDMERHKQQLRAGETKVIHDSLRHINDPDGAIRTLELSEDKVFPLPNTLKKNDLVKLKTGENVIIVKKIKDKKSGKTKYQVMKELTAFDDKKKRQKLGPANLMIVEEKDIIPRSVPIQGTAQHWAQLDEAIRLGRPGYETGEAGPGIHPSVIPSDVIAKDPYNPLASTVKRFHKKKVNEHPYTALRKETIEAEKRFEDVRKRPQWLHSNTAAKAAIGLGAVAGPFGALTAGIGLHAMRENEKDRFNEARYKKYAAVKRMTAAYDKMRETQHGIDDDDDIDHPEVLVDGDVPPEKLEAAIRNTIRQHEYAEKKASEKGRGIKRKSKRNHKVTKIRKNKRNRNQTYKKNLQRKTRRR